MKINRVKLLEAAKQAVVDEKDDHDKRVANYKIALGDYKIRWFNDNQEAWTQAVTVITNALNDCQPITKDMLPRNRSPYGYSGDVAVYVKPHRVKSATGRELNNPGEFQPSADLRSLVTILEAISDEDVTTTGLKAVGINPTVMRNVLDHIGRINAGS